MSNRTEANRANAQLSTGPRTQEGKQRSSLNALRHGLTGQIVVMPTEDLQAYQRHVASFVDDLRPKGPMESHLVQSLADTAWRLNRVASLEANCSPWPPPANPTPAPTPPATSQKKGETYTPSDDGFVFSEAEIAQARQARIREWRSNAAHRHASA